MSGYGSMGGAGATGPAGPVGAAALANGLVWTSATLASAHANEVSYIPLPPTGTTSIYCQTLAVASGTLRPTIRYSMGGAGGGNVRVRVDWLQWGDGDAANGTINTGTPVTVAMAADVNSHRLNYTSLPDLDFSLVAGDGLLIVVYRLGDDGADTHASDWQIEEVG